MNIIIMIVELAAIVFVIYISARILYRFVAAVMTGVTGQQKSKDEVLAELFDRLSKEDQEMMLSKMIEMIEEDKSC